MAGGPHGQSFSRAGINNVRAQCRAVIIALKSSRPHRSFATVRRCVRDSFFRVLFCHTVTGRLNENNALQDVNVSRFVSVRAPETPHLSA
ncbi:MAG: hypothetical protein P8182_18355, partial [Deltaproteobacteria bacterium]